MGKPDLQTTSLADLRRELEDLKQAVAEDNDPHHRDHLKSGRWPMIHNLERRIDELERSESDAKHAN